MTTKESILALFEEQRGVYFSGEEIAARLAVSRAAVWKAVNGLRKEGYEIDAVSNKGYRLAADTDILSTQGIEKYQDPVCRTLNLCVLPEAESTNTLLREKANAGAPEGTVILANTQTKGRGRRGPEFLFSGRHRSLSEYPVKAGWNDTGSGGEDHDNGCCRCMRSGRGDFRKRDLDQVGQ